MIRTLCLASLLASSLAACATQGSSSAPVSDDDPLAGEDSNDGEKADGSALQDTFGIYTATKIGAFECNGAGSCTHVDLARANRSTTLCADGTTKEACSVRGLDFTKLALSTTQLTKVTDKLHASAATPDIGAQLLVRGKYIHSSNPIHPGVDWITFQVTELWLAQMDDGNVDGTFVMIRDNGNRCFEAPCPATNEARLNSTRNDSTEGLEWPEAYQRAVSSPSWLPNRVYDAETKPDGVIVTGFRTHGTMMHLPTTLRSVEQVYLQVK